MEYDHTDIRQIYREKRPFVITIFGASGDLAKLKIFPALFALAEQKRFQTEFAIIGYARSPKSAEKFRTEFAASVQAAAGANWNEDRQVILEALLPKIHYCAGQYDERSSFEAYEAVRNQVCPDYTQEIFYFSTPPQVFIPIIDQLGACKQTDKMRLVLEKPFGVDMNSAEKLLHQIKAYFAEPQIYLLDHYLGKKAVRSILPLRYHNPLINIALESHQIASIQISALESVGVEERLGYFNNMGTIRDMIQSHLLQILALVLMEIPRNKTADTIHREKNNILEILEFVPASENVSVGQYEGFCEQDPAVCNFMTPTFAAVRLQIDRENWQGVPVFLRSGKFLQNKQTYITIELKKSIHQSDSCPSNKIIIELSPDENIHIRLVNDVGDESVEEVASSQSLACSGDHCLSEHGLLFLDVLRENRENFLSFAEIISCWRLIDQVMAFTEKQKPERYAQNSAGPASQGALLKAGNYCWHNL